MDVLPDEMLVMILKKYVYLSDLFAWRRVSKRFRYLIDNHLNRVEELRVRPKLDTYKWHFSRRLFRHRPSPLTYVKEEPVDYRNDLQIDGFPPANGSSSFPILCSNLRYLKINNIFYQCQAGLDTLNALVKLEELILGIISIGAPVAMREKLIDQGELKLPNLKVLSVESITSCKLIVNSRLKKLYYGCCFFPRYVWQFQIELKHPEHLKYLETNLGIPEQMPAFKNLQTLRFRPIKSSDLDVISQLESLQEVYFKFDELYDGYTGRMIDYLAEQMRNLNRPNPKIYFANILITRPFGEYRFKRSPLFPGRFDELLMQNYDTLADCLTDHRFFFYFDEMFSFVGKSSSPVDEKTLLPVCFFRRFRNLKFIFVHSSQTQQKLVPILKRFRNLVFLKINRIGQFTQAVINELPKSCPQLKALEIDEQEDKDQNEVVRLDYRPIWDLAFLYHLSLGNHLEDSQTVQILLDLFKESKYLAEVSIRFRKEHNDHKYRSIVLKRETYKRFSVAYSGFEANFSKQQHLGFDELKNSLSRFFRFD